MKDRTVLIVDDDQNNRSDLIHSLGIKGLITVDVESGEDAVKLMEEDPHRYQIAVVDHLLKGTITGIYTTKELVDRNQDLFVLVFTNNPSDDPADEARFRYDALSAGAYRYLERTSMEEAPIQVMDFINEIDHLTNLKNWIKGYYENREEVPSLLTQLDVGVFVIDRFGKVWFMNNAMRRITSLPGQDLPKSPCTSWYGYRFFPLPGSAIWMTFQDCKPHEGIFLLPLVNRDKEKLYFLKVWTQPIKNQNGEILKTVDKKKPLAVLASVQELTDTAQLREMDLNERLQIIADALKNRPIDGDYLGKTYFEKTEICVKNNHDDGFVLAGASGFDHPLKLVSPVDFQEYLNIAEDNIRKSRYGYFFQKAGEWDQVILWPVIEEDKTIAVIRTTGGEYSNEDSVQYIKPYAEEVRDAILDARNTGEDVGHADLGISEIDFKLQTVASPKEALQILVKSACELTKSSLPILRYREGDKAVLLNLGLDQYGEYERIALRQYPLSNSASWSCETIISGQEHIANVSLSSEEIIERRSVLSLEACKILEVSKALCFEPLLLDGRCIGSLGLHSIDATCYQDNKKIEIIRSISRRIALALHDYLVDESAQKRVTDAQYETIGLLLHNINTPLATTRYILDILRKHLSNKSHRDIKGMEHLSDISRQIDKISRIREEFLNLRRGWQSATEEIDIHVFLRSKVAELVSGKTGVTPKFLLDQKISNVKTDASAINECLKVLIQNSLDEFEKISNDKYIEIVLRLASVNEAGHLSSTSTGVAIDVADNGPGVPAEMAKDLFSIIRSGKAKGLGFGLTYSRKVARAANGDIYYHADYKDGAKFTLILPYENSLNQEQL